MPHSCLFIFSSQQSTSYDSFIFIFLCHFWNSQSEAQSHHVIVDDRQRVFLCLWHQQWRKIRRIDKVIRGVLEIILREFQAVNLSFPFHSFKKIRKNREIFFSIYKYIVKEKRKSRVLISPLKADFKAKTKLFFAIFKRERENVKESEWEKKHFTCQKDNF